MSKEQVYVLILAYLAGLVTAFIIDMIGGAVRKRRSRKKEEKILDTAYDASNYINQRVHCWEPFMVDGHTLYRLH